MRRFLHVVIALSFTLVLDKAFNHGDVTLKLFENAAAAQSWALRSGSRLAGSIAGF